MFILDKFKRFVNKLTIFTHDCFHEPICQYTTNFADYLMAFRQQTSTIMHAQCLLNHHAFENPAMIEESPG